MVDQSTKRVEVFKIMQIKQDTYQRLRNHSIYYYDDTGNTFDEIIIKLLDFYEKNYDDNNDTYTDLLEKLTK